MRVKQVLVALGVLGASFAGTTPALADGTETLGSPSIAVTPATRVLAAGVGTDQVFSAVPHQFDVSLPADAVVKQVLLYWEGHYSGGFGVADGAVAVNGIPVVGTLIGGPAFFFQQPVGTNEELYTTNRIDITGLGLVSPGTNALTITDMDYLSFFGEGNDGAGSLVLYTLPGDSATPVVEVRDGLDLAFANFPAPRDTTVPQTFTFAPSNVARTANLASLVGSISQGEVRPNQLSVTFDLAGSGDVLLQSPWNSAQGAEWDASNIPVTIPAGATQMTLHALSAGSGGLPASFAWNAAAVSIPPPLRTGSSRTIGFWKNWASCSASKGNQDPILDPTLAAAGGTILIGDLAVDTCVEAVRILDKSTVDTSAKMASDSAYKLAAQLLAAKLNFVAGATSCTAANTAATSGQTLLSAIHFTGTGAYAAGMTSAQKNAANTLASTLDAYNNNELC